MKIVILAGGTGSIALQTGLFDLLDKHIDGIETKIITNAYDNGLSTGAVRRVLGGKILGPSDVRKNQTTRLRLENASSPWLKFLDIRFTKESSKALEYCLQEINSLSEKLWATHSSENASTKTSLDIRLVTEAVQEYFNVPNADKIDYTDFSLANIVYAGFAKANGNSLRKAATIMSQIMGIKDNVLLNDDTSLFLGGITQSGVKVADEGDIVFWNNTEDPFADVYFTTPAGNHAEPQLCYEALQALLHADLIILSSGTQWSSLIPTYASNGFKEVMHSTRASVIMIMNRQPDTDSPGQTASDIIRNIVPKYFAEQTIDVILDTTAHSNMTHLDNNALSLVKSTNAFSLSSEPALSSSKHSGARLAWAVSRVYFKEYLDSSHFIFDYDDTLVGRGNCMPAASSVNLNAIQDLNERGKNISICSGNSIKAIKLRSGYEHLERSLFEGTPKIPKPLTVYADGGVNEYAFTTHIDEYGDLVATSKFIKCVNSKALLKKNSIEGIDNIMFTLRDNGIPLSKIENRGDVMVSIKPIDEEYRPAIIALVTQLIKGTDLIVRSAGRTTVEICSPALSKLSAVEYVLNSPGTMSVTYVGDELDSGNDYPIYTLSQSNPKVKCLSVYSPSKTAFFLTALRSLA